MARPRALPVVLVLIGLAVTLGAGVTLGLLGGGGSLLMVPALVYLFGRPPLEATAYSLMVVGAASLVGTLLHQQRRPLPIRRIATFGATSMVAAYVVRAVLVPHLPDLIVIGPVTVGRDRLLMLAFAVFAAAAGVAMLRQRCCAAGPRVAAAWVPVVGIATGTLTAFLGAGGGFLVLPALVLLVGLPVEEAIGASLAVVAAQSIAGALGALSVMATFHAGFALALTLTMLLGVAWGVSACGRITPGHLRRGFGWLVLAIAVVMVAHELV